MSHRTPRAGRRLALLLALAAVLVPALPAVAQADVEVEDNKKVTVMTRNLYLGTGLGNLIGVSGFPFIQAVTQDYANVVANDFPTRAGALADEIADDEPELIGLQEVSLWRTGPPDTLFGNTTPNAGTVTYDFLSLLQSALVARGLNYTVVATSTNADVEAPRLDPSSPFGFSDTRLTDRDVILAQSHIAGSVTNSQDGRYAVQLQLPVGTGTAEFTRGWTSVDATVNGATFRFFNTHLETEDAPPVQVAQGNEALGIIDSSPLPVVAVGDFNSAADGSTTSTYGNLIAGGLADAWPAANPGVLGLTCCQSELLNNAASQSATRIDLVLTKGSWRAKEAELVGNVPFRATPAPLWASDHTGVVAEVKLK